MNSADASPLPNSACTNRRVVMALPTSTTNITGFLMV